jgi:hypothetical protein
MENIYVLDYTKNHLTSEKYVDAMFIDFPGSANISPVYLTSKKLDLTQENLTLRLNFETFSDINFLSNNRTWPIFSKKLFNIMSDFKLPYKFFNITLIDPKGKKITGEYFAMQIETISGLVDHAKSIYKIDQLFKNQFTFVKKLSFNISQNTPQLFRVEEYPMLLFLRDKMKTAIELSNLSGLEITRSDQYDWSM